jgi:hypothetical protein
VLTTALAGLLTLSLTGCYGIFDALLNEQGYSPPVYTGKLITETIQLPKGACNASYRDLEGETEGSALFLTYGGWSGWEGGGAFKDLYYVYPVKLNYDFELPGEVSYHMEKDPVTGESIRVYNEPDTFRITEITDSSYTIELSRALSTNGSLVDWERRYTIPIDTAMELNTPTTDVQYNYTFKLRIV